LIRGYSLRIDAYYATRLGLRSMRETTEMLGGDLRVDSGSGTGTSAELRMLLDGRLQQPREGSRYLSPLCQGANPERTSSRGPQHLG
jgi:hypothetical protein